MKSQTSDSFVSHFDGHFAYLKTLDFSFKVCVSVCLCVCVKLAMKCKYEFIKN